MGNKVSLSVNNQLIKYKLIKKEIIKNNNTQNLHFRNDMKFKSSDFCYCRKYTKFVGG